MGAINTLQTNLAAVDSADIKIPTNIPTPINDSIPMDSMK
jgi:hypothetical protein